MGLQKNLSIVMRALRAERRQSITEFSAELGISRSSLQDILNGQGNPRIDTIEYMAKRLKMDPLTLLSCPYDEEQLRMMLLLLRTVSVVSRMSRQQQLEFAARFQELVYLLAPEENIPETPPQ